MPNVFGVNLRSGKTLVYVQGSENVLKNILKGGFNTKNAR